MPPLSLEMKLGLQRGGGSALLPETKAYLAKITADGGTYTPAYANWINEFVKLLHVENTFDKAVGIWILANQTKEASFINLFNPSVGTLGYIGSMAASGVFTQYEGWVGGSGMALTTGIDLRSNAKFNGDTASLGIYSRTNTGGSVIDIGHRAGTNTFSVLLSRTAAGNTQNSLTSSMRTGVAWDTPLTANSSGLHMINKTAATSIKSYRNNELYRTDSGLIKQTISTSAPIYICAGNYDGTLSFPSSRQISFAWIGGDLSDNQLTALNAAVDYLLSPANPSGINKRV